MHINLWKGWRKRSDINSLNGTGIWIKHNEIATRKRKKGARTKNECNFYAKLRNKKNEFSHWTIFDFREYILSIKILFLVNSDTKKAILNEKQFSRDFIHGRASCYLVTLKSTEVQFSTAKSNIPSFFHHYLFALLLPCL